MPGDLPSSVTAEGRPSCNAEGGTVSPSLGAPTPRSCQVLSTPPPRFFLGLLLHAHCTMQTNTARPLVTGHSTCRLSPVQSIPPTAHLRVPITSTCRGLARCTCWLLQRATYGPGQLHSVGRAGLKCRDVQGRDPAPSTLFSSVT